MSGKTFSVGENDRLERGNENKRVHNNFSFLFCSILSAYIKSLVARCNDNTQCFDRVHRIIMHTTLISCWCVNAYSFDYTLAHESI